MSKPPLGQDDLCVGYISFEDAAKPIDGIIQCHVNQWCIVHPERGVICHVRVVRGRPTTRKVWANPNQEITERIQKQWFPWAEVRQMPVVFNSKIEF